MAGAGTASGARRRKAAKGAGGGEAAAAARDAQAERAQNLATATRSDADRAAAWRETVRSFVIRAVVLLAFVIFNAGKGDEKEGTGGAAGAVDAALKKAGVGTGEPSVLGTLLPGVGGGTPGYYKTTLRCAWSVGREVEMRAFVVEEEEVRFEEVRGGVPQFEAKGLAFGRWEEDVRAENVTLEVPVGVRNGNGSWYVHAFLAQPEVWEMDEEAFGAVDVKEEVMHAKGELVTWVKRKRKEKSLLDGEETEEEEDGDEVAQMWKPSMELQLVTDRNIVQLGQIPEYAARQYKVNAFQTMYYPPFVVNEFWLIRDYLEQMNETVTHVKVEMTYRPMSLIKWTTMQSVEGMWETQRKLGSMREGESDDIKRMFLDTNPVLLGTTMVVSLAHSVLEMLAFRSDISHWNSKKSLEGISVRSMFWNIAMQFIVFLYLWDNETSWLITIGNGLGIAIEVWKLRKAVKVKSFGKVKLLGFIPWIELDHQDSYTDKTKEYDDEAMRYLSYIMYPCVLCYAAYTLRYEKHRSWYSWVISSLVGAVYAFGFLMMLPQVIINYRLKSVAHMPMKSFAFKALNTIIDDLFSFIIKMPWLHRLACFRDDLVFVVFLYQMYIYPVDKKRVNEFGQRGDDDEPADAAAAVQPKPAQEKKKD